ncbi:NAD kinase [Pseudonocardia sp. C8]|uniref:NAD kinase n=1 Tax=Pseudonocardia sp. C8 TaxID=2762759 RepID=UPI0016429010|nr:NAD kinase [Pseudonocardia sp. C8]MBC3191629.1 NAD kinase [Pseudonocardia sp. C8]
MREILLVLHTGRPANRKTAVHVMNELGRLGVRTRVLADEWAELAVEPDLPPGLAPVQVPAGPDCARGAVAVLILGGDGTLLRAAALARPAGAPLLGVNLGHIGFLAEAEEDTLDEALEKLAAGAYEVEERTTLQAVVRLNGEILGRTWALNEAVVEKTTRGRILEVVLEVDGRPVSSFGCDGVLCSTPTGSTAYAFSAGGPLVWPQVQALLVVPSNAHALFARPMVIAPDSAVAIEVSADGPAGVLDCDGRRTISVPPGARVELSRAPEPVRMVRLGAQPFADRLVRKFDLPVRGWRGRPSNT